MAPTLAQIRTLTSFQLFGLFVLYLLAIRALSRSLDLMTIDLPGETVSILHQLRFHTNDMLSFGSVNRSSTPVIYVEPKEQRER